MKIKNILILMFVLLISIASATEFISDSSNFNNGNFNQTFLNGNFIQLNASFSSGFYTSEILNANTTSTWDNISWEHSAIGEFEDGQINETAFADENLDMGANVLLMHMNEITGTSIEDTSGTPNNNGTYVGGLLSGTGKFDAGLVFSNDYVFSSSNGFKVSQGSMEMWIKTDWVTRTGADILFSWDSAESGDFGQLRLIISYDTNEIIFTVDEDDNNNNDVSFTYSDFTDDEFVNVVATWSNLNSGTTDAIVKIFINGDEKDIIVGTQIDVSTVNMDSDNVWIGVHKTSGFGNFFTGTLDEVTVWDRVLSDAEIINIYKRGAVSLNVSARSCDDALCDVETFTDIGVDSPLNLSLGANQYLQYKFGFETENFTYSPELYNVTVKSTANTPPSIINCQVNTTSLTCNEFIELSCNVTDDAGVSNVSFGFDDSDGKNFQEASLDTGDIYSLIKQYTEITSGLNRTYNFTNATATNIFQNTNATLLDISYNYSCFAPDIIPPVIILNPAFVNNTIVDLRITNQTVNFTVTDNIAILNISWVVFNDSGIIIGNDLFLNGTSSNFNVLDEVDISSFSAGNYFINRVAYDLENNSAETLSGFTLVDFDLFILLTSPANESEFDITYQYVKEGNIGLTFTLGSPSSCSLLINDSILSTASYPSGSNTIDHAVTQDSVTKWGFSCTEDISGENISSAFRIFTVSFNEVFEEFKQGTCPLNSIPQTLMFMMFFAISFGVMVFAKQIGHGLAGSFGAFLMLILSFYLYTCLLLFGIFLTGISVFLMFWFISRGSKNDL